MKKAPAYISSAFKIEELAFWLMTLCDDNNLDPRELSLDDVIGEARATLSLFSEPNTTSWNMLHGEHGIEDQKHAIKNVKQIKAFIRKYSTKQA
jgi:hypothetical protein